MALTAQTAKIFGSRPMPVVSRTDVSCVNRFSIEERIDYLRSFGDHCMSFSALQPGMDYFDVPGKGYIAYRQKWGSRMALADPVCDPADQETVVGEFLTHFKDRSCGFIQLTEPVAGMIHENFGYYATQFGIETVVDLESWNLKGKKKQTLRTAVNKAKKEGVVIKESYHEQRHIQLTEEWMATRKVKNREIGFLIRPMIMDHEEHTRKFFAYLNDELIGFVFFDPIYRNGEIVSYVPNISRFKKSFRQGIFYALMVHAMDQFKSEGIKELNLGLTILALDNEYRSYESKALKQAERLLFNYGNSIYNFRGIHFTKSRFQGRENKFYCVHKAWMPAMKLLTVIKLANVF